MLSRAIYVALGVCVGPGIATLTAGIANVSGDPWVEYLSTNYLGPDLIANVPWSTVTGDTNVVLTTESGTRPLNYSYTITLLASGDLGTGQSQTWTYTASRVNGGAQTTTGTLPTSPPGIRIDVSDQPRPDGVSEDAFAPGRTMSWSGTVSASFEASWQAQGASESETAVRTVNYSRVITYGPSSQGNRPKWSTLRFHVDWTNGDVSTPNITQHPGQTYEELPDVPPEEPNGLWLVDIMNPGTTPIVLDPTVDGEKLFSSPVTVQPGHTRLELAYHSTEPSPGFSLGNGDLTVTTSEPLPQGMTVGGTTKEIQVLTSVAYPSGAVLSSGTSGTSSGGTTVTTTGTVLAVTGPAGTITAIQPPPPTTFDPDNGTGNAVSSNNTSNTYTGGTVTNVTNNYYTGEQDSPANLAVAEGTGQQSALADLDTEKAATTQAARDFVDGIVGQDWNPITVQMSAGASTAESISFNFPAPMGAMVINLSPLAPLRSVWQFLLALVYLYMSIRLMKI